MIRHYIIPVFVPHYGCPHDCVFCNQNKITGFETDVTESQVETIIYEYLATFKKDSFIEVAFYGGSFTAIDFETQKRLLGIPRRYKEEGKINGIRLSTRPDAIDHVILTMLKENLVDTIELGVQSMDPVVLKLSERGHSDEDVFISSMMI
jgi:histone acetyltransferase (RNA polymerase elongator complex component)